MNVQLFEENSSKFKHIFSRISSKEGHLGLANFQVFCKNLNIIPGLITPIDLKRHVDKIIKVPSSRATLSYSQFEGLLKEICFSSFQSSVPSDRISLFFTHIEEPCMSAYKVQMSKPSRRKHHSNDFSSKREEANSSLDIDNNIKEALETLKSKDESFRSSRSTLSREVSPVPSIKTRMGEQVSTSSSNLHRRPFLNKSMPDSPNTSVLGARPSSRYHNPMGKESELDEFLKTERLVENQIVQSKPTGFRPPSKAGSKNTISIKKIEYSKSKPDLMNYSGKQSIRGVLHGEKINPARNLKKISVSLAKSTGQVLRSDLMLKRMKKFFKRKVARLVSPALVVRMVFISWKQDWLFAKLLKNNK